ncbi:VOC family protein [Streptomyces roseoverticillatus]|uniref:VOC family protein n=1 Tax=Streptomyces roseoverticillatus TaxID=66429 RepID=UPI0004BF1A19|nr:VOC family protein [Streptomyces roseoverticillatus]
MNYERLDHTVLTVNDIDATVDFYSRVLGMEIVTFSMLVNDRKALRFGNTKINLHEVGKEIAPHAQNPGPGTEHLCFIVADSIEEVIAHLQSEGAVVESGPVERVGVLGPINSVYVRDPDGNLLELSNHIER